MRRSQACWNPVWAGSDGHERSWAADLRPPYSDVSAGREGPPPHCVNGSSSSLRNGGRSSLRNGCLLAA
eukprot:7310229-Alexandrium_andersonii.AAC.1